MHGAAEQMHVVFELNLQRIMEDTRRKDDQHQVSCFNANRFGGGWRRFCLHILGRTASARHNLRGFRATSLSRSRTRWTIALPRTYLCRAGAADPALCLRRRTLQAGSPGGAEQRAARGEVAQRRRPSRCWGTAVHLPAKASGRTFRELDRLLGSEAYTPVATRGYECTLCLNASCMQCTGTEQ
jgi:hypothetical protein